MRLSCTIAKKSLIVPLIALPVHSLLAVFLIACIPYPPVQSFILAKNAQIISQKEEPSLRT